MTTKYARGSRAWGVCGRSGRKMLLRDMVFDGRFPNMRVDPDWYEGKHPQENMPKVEDPVALYRPAPEVVQSPSAPVLAATLNSTAATLTWTPAESDITEISSYTIYRSVDSGPFSVLIVCAVLRDFLGGIRGVQNCTTTVTPPGSDKQPVDDAPITYVDTTLVAGHTYCYNVVGSPMGNNQSNNQGPPSAPSNTACVTVVGPGLVTFSIGAAFNSTGPFLGQPNNSFEPGYGEQLITPSGASCGTASPEPVSVNLAQVVVFGQIKNDVNGHLNVLCLVGTHAQAKFIDVTFDDGVGNHYVLTSAAAGFNTPWNSPGYTTWTWPVVTAFPPLNQPITVRW